MADLCEPDLRTTPALAAARALEGELHPGEVLWLPRYHWHQVRQAGASDENLSLNFWVGEKGTTEFASTVRSAPLRPPPQPPPRRQGGGEEGGGEEGGPAALPREHATAIAWLHASRMVESADALHCPGHGRDASHDASETRPVGGARHLWGAERPVPQRARGGRRRALARRLARAIDRGAAARGARRRDRRRGCCRLAAARDDARRQALAGHRR